MKKVRVALAAIASLYLVTSQISGAAQGPALRPPATLRPALQTQEGRRESRRLRAPSNVAEGGRRRHERNGVGRPASLL